MSARIPGPSRGRWKVIPPTLWRWSSAASSRMLEAFSPRADADVVDVDLVLDRHEVHRAEQVVKLDERVVQVLDRLVEGAVVGRVQPRHAQQARQEVGEALAELAHLVREGAVLADARSPEGAGEGLLGPAQVVGRHGPGRWAHPRDPPPRASSAAAASGAPRPRRARRAARAAPPRPARPRPQAGEGDALQGGAGQDLHQLARKPALRAEPLPNASSAERAEARARARPAASASAAGRGGGVLLHVGRSAGKTRGPPRAAMTARAASRTGSCRDSTRWWSPRASRGRRCRGEVAQRLALPLGVVLRRGLAAACSAAAGSTSASSWRSTRAVVPVASRRRATSSPGACLYPRTTRLRRSGARGPLALLGQELHEVPERRPRRGLEDLDEGGGDLLASARSARTSAPSVRASRKELEEGLGGLRGRGEGVADTRPSSTTRSAAARRAGTRAPRGRSRAPLRGRGGRARAAAPRPRAPPRAARPPPTPRSAGARGARSPPHAAAGARPPGRAAAAGPTAAAPRNARSGRAAGRRRAARRAPPPGRSPSIAATLTLSKEALRSSVTRSSSCCRTPV
jgi:hypothetical protein